MSHFVGLYVERHNPSEHKAECSCGWKTDWKDEKQLQALVSEHRATADQHSEGPK